MVCVTQSVYLKTCYLNILCTNILQELNINTNSMYILRAVLSAVSGIKSLGTGNIYIHVFLFIIVLYCPKYCDQNKRGRKQRRLGCANQKDIHFSGFLTLAEPEN